MTTAIWDELEGAGVGFVSLGHYQLARPEAGIGGLAAIPRPGELAADEERGTRSGGSEGVNDHARGGRFAMGAGHSDEPAFPAQLGEQRSAVNYALVALARALKLRIVRSDCGRDDHLCVGRNKGSVVSNRRLEASGTKALHVSRLRAVGPGDARAEAVRNERKATHAGASDGDEVKLSPLPGGLLMRHLRSS